MLCTNFIKLGVFGQGCPGWGCWGGCAGPGAALGDFGVPSVDLYLLQLYGAVPWLLCTQGTFAGMGCLGLSTQRWQGCCGDEVTLWGRGDTCRDEVTL